MNDKAVANNSSRTAGSATAIRSTFWRPLDEFVIENGCKPIAHYGPIACVRARYARPSDSETEATKLMWSSTESRPRPIVTTVR
jgi:hypothetical protein